MLALPIVDAAVALARYSEAADLYRAARRLGLTVRSSVDCLIAACAVRRGLAVLHRDRDFAALSRVCGLRHRDILESG